MAKDSPVFFLVVFLLALALRLDFIALTDFGMVVRGDAVANVSYAYNLVDHGVFSSAIPGPATPVPDSYRGPGYPLFLASTVAASGGSLAWMGWLRILQSLLGALTAVLTIMLARRVLPSAAAVCCGLLVALWPHLITSSGFFLSETLAGFLFLSAVTTTETGLIEGDRKWLAGAGLLWGLAWAVNPVFLLAPLVYLRQLVRLEGKHLVVLFLLPALAFPVLWAARNATLAVPAASSSSRALTNLVQGSWPDYHAAYASRNAAAEPARILHEIGAEDALLQNDKRAGLSAIASRMAADPARYAWWYLVYKPFLLWDWPIRIGNGDIYTLPALHSPFERPGPLALIKAAAKRMNFWIWIAAVGYCIGTFTKLPRHGGITVPQSIGLRLIVMFVYLTLVHVVLQAEPRYAIPYRPLEFILALLALHAVVTCYPRRRVAPAAV